MDASYKIQRGIHVHLIQFFMCPEFWVHIRNVNLSFVILTRCIIAVQHKLICLSCIWILLLNRI